MGAVRRVHEIGIFHGHGEEGTGKERESKTYLLGIVAGACLYVCRLSLFNFEKHAKAGSNIAKNESETQKAMINPIPLSLECPSSKLTFSLPIQFICPLILIFPFPTF